MAQNLVVIAGTTASGKSDLAIKIAQENNGEIIAADSRTIYKQMDVGTAKPSDLDREKIQHYGLDLVEPGENYNVRLFKEYAESKIKDIAERGKLPIIAGGTGLYIDSVVYDYEFDDEDTTFKLSLMDKSLEELQKLAIRMKLKPSNDMLHNKRHLVSAIMKGDITEKNYESSYNYVYTAILPSKSSLRNNINARVEKMFKQGLRKEVDDLVEQFGWSHESMSGIGYKEFKAYYDGEISMSKVKRDIAANTLKYAKRQKTWFKRNPHAIICEHSDEAYECINKFLRKL